jgi:hypothetical protein
VTVHVPHRRIGPGRERDRCAALARGTCLEDHRRDALSTAAPRPGRRGRRPRRDARSNAPGLPRGSTPGRSARRSSRERSRPCRHCMATACRCSRPTSTPPSRSAPTRGPTPAPGPGPQRRRQRCSPIARPHGRLAESGGEPEALTCEHPCRMWWAGEDSNLRRRCRQIYSLLPLATRAPTLGRDTVAPRAAPPPHGKPSGAWR